MNELKSKLSNKNRFLMELCGNKYDYVKMKNNALNDSYSQVLLYDKLKLFVVNISYQWIGDNDYLFNNGLPNSQVLCVKLAPIVNKKIAHNSSFWIAMTSLDDKEKNNYKQIMWLKTYIKNTLNNENHIIIMKSNFFNDKKSNRHIDIMENNYINTIEENNKIINLTDLSCRILQYKNNKYKYIRIKYFPLLFGIEFYLL